MLYNIRIKNDKKEKHKYSKDLLIRLLYLCALFSVR